MIENISFPHTRFEKINKKIFDFNPLILFDYAGKQYPYNEENGYGK